MYQPTKSPTNPPNPSPVFRHDLFLPAKWFPILPLRAAISSSACAPIQFRLTNSKVLLHCLPRPAAWEAPMNLVRSKHNALARRSNDAMRALLESTHLVDIQPGRVPANNLVVPAPIPTSAVALWPTSPNLRHWRRRHANY